MKGTHLGTYDSFSAVNGYIRELTKLTGADKTTALSTAKNLGSEHFLDVLRSLFEIDNLHKETVSILKDFCGRQTGLVRILTIDHLVLSIKLYVINWSTMTDMIASLINIVFDLGVADGDTHFEVIMRNKHVQKSNMPEILKKHSNSVLPGIFTRHRNQIVHRGRIGDEDVMALRTEKIKLDSNMPSFLGETGKPSEEYERYRATFPNKLSDLARQKRAHYESHYTNTLNMVSEILVALAKISCDKYRTSCDLKPG